MVSEQDFDGKKYVERTEVLTKMTLLRNDNLSNIITHIQHRGENYDKWTKAMRTSLRARRK
jgi:hypothetical protein